MRRFADEIDQFFGGFSPRRAEGEAVASWWPPMEVTQDDGKLTLCFDLPGMKSEDVKVEVTDDTLMVKGERKREREEKGKGFYRSERHYGSFARSIPLPQGAETDKVRAEFANGELKVSIPVPQATASRREIPIQSR